MENAVSNVYVTAGSRFWSAQSGFPSVPVSTDSCVAVHQDFSYAGNLPSSINVFTFFHISYKDDSLIKFCMFIAAFVLAVYFP